MLTSPFVDISSYPMNNPFNSLPHNPNFYRPSLLNRKSLQMTILKLIKMAESTSDGWKTLREKEKLLVVSNFCFSHGVFKRLILQTREDPGLFGKGLRKKALENNVGEEKTLVTSNFSLSHSVFHSIKKRCC